ncbi:hypothetical protein GGR50DRAFT_692013 [Xylaria sp. CBS 124048]|nr:hypothetical protein GGR50DRAFT_692013 [Xylaria sp. CBS 124048]
MCCHDDRDPIPLAGGTALVCCPHGADCSLIQVFTCNITMYDPHPEAKDPPDASTIWTESSLKRCGNGCCIWGYICSDLEDGYAVCKLAEDQSHQPDGEPATIIDSSSTSVVASTSVGTSAGTVSTIPTNATDPNSEQPVISTISSPLAAEKSPNPGKSAIAGIAVGGALFLALLAGAVFLFFRRYQRIKNNANNSSNTEQDNIKPGQLNAEVEKPFIMPPHNRISELDGTPVHIYELE